jgi:hypothetical protein
MADYICEGEPMFSERPPDTQPSTWSQGLVPRSQRA